MGQVLHGSAGTTSALRRALQQRPERIAMLATPDDLNPKTGATGKAQTSLAMMPRWG